MALTTVHRCARNFQYATPPSSRCRILFLHSDADGVPRLGPSPQCRGARPDTPPRKPATFPIPSPIPSTRPSPPLLRPAAAGQGGAPFRLWKEDCFFGFAVGKKLALGASVRQNGFFPSFPQNVWFEGLRFHSTAWNGQNRFQKSFLIRDGPFSRFASVKYRNLGISIFGNRI